MVIFHSSKPKYLKFLHTKSIIYKSQKLIQSSSCREDNGNLHQEESRSPLEKALDKSKLWTSSIPESQAAKRLTTTGEITQ